MLIQCAHAIQGFNVGGIKYFDYKRLPEDVERELGATFSDMDDVVSTADIVTIHVPLSDKTYVARILAQKLYCPTAAACCKVPWSC